VSFPFVEGEEDSFQKESLSPQVIYIHGSLLERGIGWYLETLVRDDNFEARSVEYYSIPAAAYAVIGYSIQIPQKVLDSQEGLEFVLSLRPGTWGGGL